jgi:APA family basic amino acid/polyamine antiporter
MKTDSETADPHGSPNKLLRILGIGFGLAICVGGTIGVGILRNPGGVAGHIPSVWLILLAWTLGGVYALLSANYLAELATAIPKAGGYFVYAHRAYGAFGGFAVGWSDWLYQTLGLSFIAVVFGEYSVELFKTNFAGDRVAFSVSILILLTILNWIGLRSGSAMQKLTSVLKAVALIAFVIACFVYGGQSDPEGAAQTPAVLQTAETFAPLIAFILAFQLVLGTYDGWHSAIYFTEEDTNPSRNLPRSLFGGIAMIVAIYLLVNIALLYVLPMSQLVGSKFAGADAISLIFGPLSGQIVTTLALLSIAGIINALLLMSPRILLALSREGLFAAKAAEVNKGGTPTYGLAATALTAVILSSIGTFELLLAVSQFFAVTITTLLVISLFVLRRREPDLARPYRAWGYPILPFVVLVITVLLVFGYITSNPYPSFYALVLLAVSYPIFLLIKSRAPLKSQEDRRN